MSTFETAHLGLEEKLEAELDAITKIGDVVERGKELDAFVEVCEGHLAVCNTDLVRMESEVQNVVNPSSQIPYDNAQEIIEQRRQIIVDVLFKARRVLQILSSSEEYRERCSAIAVEGIAQINESEAAKKGAEKPEDKVEDQRCATCEKVGDLVVVGEKVISRSYKGLVKALPRPRRAGGENGSGKGKKNGGNGMSA